MKALLPSFPGALKSEKGEEEEEKIDRTWTARTRTKLYRVSAPPPPSSRKKGPRKSRTRKKKKA